MASGSVRGGGWYLRLAAALSVGLAAAGAGPAWSDQVPGTGPELSPGVPPSPPPAPTPTPAPASPAPLAAFVTQADPTYAYRAGPWKVAGGVRVAELALTSQSFRGAAWKHVVAVVVPKTVKTRDHAILLVGGGDAARKTTPADDLARLAALATRTGMLVAEVQQVPNQPIFDGKREDAAISYTLAEFFKTGDPTWPLLAPMVKSVVRAMDAVQDFARASGWPVPAGFTVTGASKRGWTTWLTAAVDPRVKAFVPLVFDIVNMRPQLDHQLLSWGRYSEEIGDYSDRGLPAMLATPRGGELVAVVDPYAYKEALTQPKLVALATNDPYWPVDAAQRYFPALTGPKYLLYVPNVTHDGPSAATVVSEDRAAMALGAAGKLALPDVDVAYDLPEGAAAGTLRLVASVEPKAVRLWQAKAPTRDFRKATWRVAAHPTPARRVETALAVPPTGFVAAFLEARFVVDGVPFTVCTPAGIAGKDRRWRARAKQERIGPRINACTFSARAASSVAPEACQSGVGLLQRRSLPISLAIRSLALPFPA
jgi:PhoPQ-activated pathogenicity-related protein